MSSSRHTGFGVAVIMGIGFGWTMTDIDAGRIQPATLVTVTEYVPASAGEISEIVGLWSVDKNPFGPAHE